MNRIQRTRERIAKLTSRYKEELRPLNEILDFCEEVEAVKKRLPRFYIQFAEIIDPEVDRTKVRNLLNNHAYYPEELKTLEKAADLYESMRKKHESV